MMRRLSIAILTLLLVSVLCTSFVTVAEAQQSQVNLIWDANTEADLAGYRVYWGTASRTYTLNQDNGNQIRATIGGLADGTWYFAVTAYDTFKNESGFSEEVSIKISTLPPPPPLVAPPGTPVATTIVDGVKWDWPPCQGCTGYFYRYEGGEGETAKPGVLILGFTGNWFCVTAKELGWGDSALVRCNRYEPPPDVTPPEPPKGLIIQIPEGTTGIKIEFLKEGNK